MLHQNKLKLYNKYKKNNYWKTSKFTNFDLNKKYYSLYNLRLVSLSTFYKKKLTTKQCLKDYLGKITERQFKKNLLNNSNFEQRLDFNLYRSNLVRSIYMARFCITKGYILVNNHIVNKPNYILKQNDLIEINPLYWTSFNKKLNSFVQYSIENNIYLHYKTIYNLEVDYATYSFIYLGSNKNTLLTNNNKLKHLKNIKLNKYYLKKKDTLKNYNKTIYYDDIYTQFIKRFYKL